LAYWRKINIFASSATTETWRVSFKEKGVFFSRYYKSPPLTSRCRRVARLITISGLGPQEGP
jgi:hypothetical protein